MFKLCNRLACVVDGCKLAFVDCRILLKLSLIDAIMDLCLKTTNKVQ